MFRGNYRNRNQFQEYFLEFVDIAERQDSLGYQQLMDELTQEQFLYIWKHLASYTRAKLKCLT